MAGRRTRRTSSSGTCFPSDPDVSSRSFIERRSRRSFRFRQPMRPVRGAFRPLTLGLALLASVVFAGIVGAQVGTIGQETAAAPLGPTRLTRPEGGPPVLQRPAVAVPLVAIRLSIPLTDGVLPGAARTFAHLAGPELEAAARSVGGTARVQRTPGHVVFSVEGPERSLDVLASALRRAVLEPPFTAQALVRARAAAEEEILATLERPDTRARALLRRRVYLDDAGLETDAAGLSRLTLERLRHLWSAQTSPERMRVVLVGPVPEPLVLAAFGRWPAPRMQGSPADSAAAAAPERPAPQVLRPWAGIAFRVDGAEPGALAVAAELVRRRVAASALARGLAEVWWQPQGPALAVLGSAEGDAPALAAARASAPPLRAGPSGEALGASDLVLYLRRMVAEAAALLKDDQVAAAARSLRWELLYAARTPAGLAELLGAMEDATGAADGAARLVESLGRVSTDAVRALLERMLAATPAFVEVAP